MVDYCILLLDTMAKIGNLEYPELSFSDALRVIEGVRTKRITTVDGLARELGHKSPKSGAFFVKTAALNKYYGLVDQQKTDISLTERAKRILISPSEKERAEARQEAVLGIPLFRSLYSKLGSDYNRNDFVPILRDLSGAKLEELPEKGGAVQRMYEDALQHLVPTKVNTILDQAPPPVSGSLTQPAPPGMLVVQVPNSPPISVPWDPHFIDSVCEFLRKQKEALEIELAARDTAPAPQAKDKTNEPA